MHYSDLATQTGAAGLRHSVESGTLCHRRPFQPDCGRILLPSIRVPQLPSRPESVALRTRARSARLLGLLLVCLPACSLADWRLVWNDEFNGVAVDASRWTYDIGTGPPFPGWGNNELEYYTSRPQNVVLSNGLLHIIAQKENFGGAAYTSARLKTQGRFSTTYGRFEFRARLPTGQGFWPAFWLMPRDSVYGSWAASGEVDIMENRGQDPATVFGTLHFGGEYPTNTQSFGPSFKFQSGDSVANFHVYALEWSTNSFSWYVDDQLYETQTSWWSSGGPFPAPFNQPFYLLLNLAVGGHFVGDPNAGTVFPGELQVDYVRVYDYSPGPVPALRFIAIRGPGATLVLAGTNGPPSGTFYLLGTLAPAQPLSQWTRVSTNQFDSQGAFRLNLAPPSSSAFYRLEVP
jgi:beta-glucanase (GH16 family)